MSTSITSAIIAAVDALATAGTLNTLDLSGTSWSRWYVHRVSPYFGLMSAHVGLPAIGSTVIWVGSDSRTYSTTIAAATQLNSQTDWEDIIVVRFATLLPAAVTTYQIFPFNVAQYTDLQHQGSIPAIFLNQSGTRLICRWYQTISGTNNSDGSAQGIEFLEQPPSGSPEDADEGDVIVGDSSGPFVLPVASVKALLTILHGYDDNVGAVPYGPSLSIYAGAINATMFTMSAGLGLTDQLTIVDLSAYTIFSNGTNAPAPAALPPQTLAPTGVSLATNVFNVSDGYLGTSANWSLGTPMAGQTLNLIAPNYPSAHSGNSIAAAAYAAVTANAGNWVQFASGATVTTFTLLGGSSDGGGAETCTTLIMGTDGTACTFNGTCTGNATVGAGTVTGSLATATLSGSSSINGADFSGLLTWNSTGTVTDTLYEIELNSLTLTTPITILANTSGNGLKFSSGATLTLSAGTSLTIKAGSIVSGTLTYNGSTMTWPTNTVLSKDFVISYAAPSGSIAGSYGKFAASGIASGTYCSFAK